MTIESFVRVAIRTASLLFFTGGGLPSGIKAQAPDYQFRPPVQVNQRNGPQDYHMTYSSGGRALARYGDVIYAVYSNHSRGNWDVMFTVSRDGGRSFGPSRVVNDTTQGEPSDQLSPSIAVDGAGTIYVAWQDNRTIPSNIYQARSLDGGVTFGAIQKVGPKAGGGQFTPAIATGIKGQVYVVWSENLPTGSRLFFGRSRDGGNHFQVHFVDTSAKVDQHQPALAVGSEGNIYIAWTEASGWPSQVSFARSTDRGETFFPKNRISDISPGNQFAPSLSTGPNGEVYGVWTDLGKDFPRVRFTKSLNRGVTFSPVQMLGDVAARAADQPSVSVATSRTGRVAVAWEDMRAGPGQIAGTYSLDGGATFRPDFLMGKEKDPQATQSFPSLAFGAMERLNVTWTGYRVQGGEVKDDIFFSQGEQLVSGATLTPSSPSVPLTLDSLYQNFPDPMSNSTTIAYDLLGEKESSFVSLVIYDLSYQKVRTLVSQWQSPGSYRVIWDGHPDNVVNVTNGVYYYQLIVSHPNSGEKAYTSTKRLVVAR